MGTKMKTIIIGIDGMDYKFTKRLINEGKLPNFKKLETFSELKPNYPPNSPVCWTTLATGKNPGEHSIYDFIKINPENYLPELSLFKQKFTNLGIEYRPSNLSKPFWKIAEEKNIKTKIIRWPLTFPIEESKTKILAGLGVPDIKGFLSGNSFYTSKKIEKKLKPTNKIIYVTQQKIIRTKIFGPKEQTNEGQINLTSELIINLEKQTIKTNISKIKFKKNKWSDWLSISFKNKSSKKIQAIFKVFISNIKPFEMFVTSLQIDPTKPLIKISNPEEYSKIISKEIKQKYYTLGIAEETDGLNEGFIDYKSFLEQTKEIDDEKTKIFWNEFKKFKDGIFAFVFDTSDRLQHMFWQKDKKIIEKYFIEKDKFIGELLNKIGNTTKLFIVSDHGFEKYDYSININKWLYKNNYLHITSEKSKFPLENIDWKKTKAYSIGFNSIYLNLKNRESEGIILEKEKKKLEDEIKKKLENLKHNHKKVINKIYKSKEVWSGNLKSAPELIVGFMPRYRMSWKSALGDITEEIISKNNKKWNADHLIDPKFVKGIFFCNKKINPPKKQEDFAKIILDS